MRTDCVPACPVRPCSFPSFPKQIAYDDEGDFVVVKHAALVTSTLLSKVLAVRDGSTSCTFGSTSCTVCTVQAVATGCSTAVLLCASQVLDVRINQISAASLVVLDVLHVSASHVNVMCHCLVMLSLIFITGPQCEAVQRDCG